MANYKYTLVGGKIGVEIPNRKIQYFPYHELTKLGISDNGSSMSVWFRDGNYSADITTADNVTIGETVIAPGSLTIENLAKALAESSVFQKASSGSGPASSLTLEDVDFIKSLRNSGN